MSNIPSFFTNPEAYSRVRIGGHLILATLKEVDGNKLTEGWDQQKGTGKSGAKWVFKGSEAAGPHKLTFEVVSAAEEADLRMVYEMMAPKPGSNVAPKAAATTTTTAAPPPSPPTLTAEQVRAQAQAALAALNNPTAPAAPGAATASSTAAAGTSPGPAPPTLTIENAFLAYVGTTAVSRKSFTGPIATKTNSLTFIIELIPQKPPVDAGVGLAPQLTSNAQASNAQQQTTTNGTQAMTAAYAAGAGT